MSGVTEIAVGSRLLMREGSGIVVGIHRHGLQVRLTHGEVRDISYADCVAVQAIEDGQTKAIHRALQPVWATLPAEARGDALNRLEIVQEILTGYRDGHTEFARPGEPFDPFGPGFGLTINRRCEVMADRLTAERRTDQELQRRVARGELKSATVAKSTVKRWVTAFKKGDLLALVDGRSMQSQRWVDQLDAQFKEVADRVIGELDGSISAASQSELKRRIDLELKSRGTTDARPPGYLADRYVSLLCSFKGRTTRSHRTRKLQGASGKKHFAAVRPGQVVAIDATGADGLVFDELHERVFSVEILTAIDVCTRTVLALRVVPKSADAVDASLLLFDVLRPFSQVVDGGSVSDWVWAGVPETLDLSCVNATLTRQRVLPDQDTVTGVHHIPSVRPDSIRCDHGNIFISDHFRLVLAKLGVELSLSRVKRPPDNAHMERWHETLQRGIQQIPGYKGRNVGERGREVHVAEEALMTARELERYLRAWVALDYHRSWHQGLAIPNAPGARLTPLEYFDAMLEATGRIDVPQRADMVFDFLPVRRGTVGPTGVEFHNLVYDADCLDEFRKPYAGQFIKDSRQTPFLYDPHDVSRIWFRHPDTDEIHEVPWRGVDMLAAPMTEKILDHVRKRIAKRGGNSALKRGLPSEQILDELGSLHAAVKGREVGAMLSAAQLRVSQSRRDLDEAHHRQARRLSNVESPRSVKEQGKSQPRRTDEVSIFDDAWPDLSAEVS